MEATKAKVTRADVEKLKADWKQDPCWDIEHTGEGFEEYHDELLQFRKDYEAEREKEQREKENAEMQRLGITDKNIYKLFKDLEFKITWKVRELENENERLRQRIYRLENA